MYHVWYRLISRTSAHAWQACVEYGFFYVINHGVDRGLLERVFAESRSFFQQPMVEKMALRKNSSHRGYTAPYSGKVDDLIGSRLKKED